MIGVDNYSYHRLLGEVRAGECPPAGEAVQWVDTIALAAAAGASVVALETCFMDRASAIRELSSGPTIETVLSWGHPYGLEFGASPEAEEDAVAWLTTAAALGHDRMRIVIAHPHLRAPDGWRQVEASVAVLTRLAATASAFGLTLAIENHADVTARQLAWLIETVGSPALAVCFDIVNAIRVGDDPVEAARVLGPYTAMAHVKDVAPGQWHPRSGPASVPLGSGVVPIEAVLAELGTGGRDPWLLVELGHLGPLDVDECAVVEGDVRWLRQHVPWPVVDRPR